MKIKIWDNDHLPLTEVVQLDRSRKVRGEKMPRIAELKEINGAIWARLDIDIESDDQPVSLLVASEVAALKKNERELCVQAIQDHIGFTEDEKRIAVDVIRAA